MSQENSIRQLLKEQLELSPEAEKHSQEFYEDRKAHPILELTTEGCTFKLLMDEVERAKKIFIQELHFIPMYAAAQNWLLSLSNNATRRKYASYYVELQNRQIFPTSFANGAPFSVGGLRNINLDTIIESIDKINDLSNTAKKARIECYLSFVGYLNRITDGWFKKALPSSAKKLSLYRSSVRSYQRALSREQWELFLAELYKINERDYLIAVVMFYGAQRISEVLSLKIDQVDFEANSIRYQRTIKKITHEQPIEYPATIMKALKSYVKSTKPHRKGTNCMFITRNGNRIIRSRLNYSFDLASRKAKVKKVSPDSIRATWLMLQQEPNNNGNVDNITNQDFKRI